MEHLKFQVFYQKPFKIFSLGNSEKFSGGATWVDLFQLSVYTQMNM